MACRSCRGPSLVSSTRSIGQAQATTCGAPRRPRRGGRRGGTARARNCAGGGGGGASVTIRSGTLLSLHAKGSDVAGMGTIDDAELQPSHLATMLGGPDRAATWHVDV